MKWVSMCLSKDLHHDIQTTDYRSLLRSLFVWTLQIRKLEIVIGMLLLVVGGCFFAVMVHASPDPEEIVTGMFMPRLSGGRATRDAVALLGALIMP